MNRYGKGLLGVVAATVAAFVLTDGPANSAPEHPVNGVPLTTPAFPGVVRPPVVTNGKLYVTNGVTMSVYGR